MNGWIAVGVDGSRQSDAAVDWAIDEARMTGRGLRVVTAFPATTPSATTPSTAATKAPYRSEASQRAETVANAASERALLQGVRSESRTARGQAGAVLVDQSEFAEMVVVGSRMRTGLARLVGSTSLALAERSHCPAVVVTHRLYSTSTGQDPHDGSIDLATSTVRGPEDLRTKFARRPFIPDVVEFVDTVVVAIEPLTGENAALWEAARAADARKKPLSIVHVLLRIPEIGVWPVTDFADDHFRFLDDRMKEIVQQVRTRYPNLSVESQFFVGDAASILVKISYTAELLVLGRRGLSKFKGLLLGSTSQTVLQKIAAPTMVVPNSPPPDNSRSDLNQQLKVLSV